MRQKIYEIIEPKSKDNKLSHAYDFFMMTIIMISLVPLFFKEENAVFFIIDHVTAGIFIIDYILRLITADIKLKKGKLSFLYYPVTFMAIIDLLTILPTFLTFMWPGLKVMKVLRLIRTFKVFRIFKGFRYSKYLDMVIEVIRQQKRSLMAVCVVAIGYLLIIALIMFNAEPETFPNFFDAFYWATISLTTVGYGDIYASSAIGRIITMISALFGVAIVALPAGLISAGFMSELEKRKEEKNEETQQTDHDRN